MEELSVNPIISHYRILSKLGEGGMGEVYRARDTKLNREVAIKILPEAFAQDEERVGRFKREAQVLASLNHPNIAAIYGVEESDGIRALVMELVEGPTLADRIAAGPIPLDEALAIARQIAEALEVAHERGVIHRDLKPANVKVTPEDKVKVLDFGLAKLSSNEAPSNDLSHSPTMIQGTQAGMILGTAAYMSPEQARGRPVDKRTDLWAFGVVLVEMLTGAPLFAGDTVSDVIAAVLTKPVDWTSLPAGTPAPVRRLARRCLEKDRKHRLADAGSARLEIDDALASKGEDIPTASAPAPEISWRRTVLRVILPAVIITALLAALLGWALQRGAPTANRQLTLTIVPPQGVRLEPVGTMGATPHISPDGSAVLFLAGSTRSLYVRRLDSLDFVQVAGSNMVSNEPFWNGSSAISFPSAQNKLLGVRLPDGAPETVMPLDGFTRGGSWSDAGTVLVSGISHLVTREADGASASIDIPGDRTGQLLYPAFLPGSEDFLALFKPDGSEGEVWLATLSDGAVTNPTVLFKNDTAAAYTPWDGGRVLYVKNDNLYSQRLNRSKRAIEGQAELVARGVASQPGLMRAEFSVARDGTVAWRPGQAALAQVIVFDRRGAVIGAAGPPGPIESVFVSPTDNSRLLVMGRDRWLVDVGQAGRVALPGEVDWFNWSPDGARIMGSQRDGRLVSRLADGAGGIDSIGQLPQELSDPKMLSPDGKFLLARRPASGGAAWAPVPEIAAAAAWTPLVASDELHADLSFSPDGRFVLYDVFRGDGVYVQPFPGPGRRQLVDQKGIDAVWRGDGKEIVFTRDNAVWSVAVTTSGGSLVLGSPQRLFEGVRRAPGAVAQSQGLAVSRDGSRFFLVQGVEQPEADVIHVMTAPRR